jgi:hypothetical protein
MDDGDEYGSFCISKKPAPFANLVALSVRWPGNRLEDSFPLDLVLEVEEHHLPVRLKPSFLRRMGRKLLEAVGLVETAFRLR